MNCAYKMYNCILCYFIFKKLLVEFKLPWLELEQYIQLSLGHHQEVFKLFFKIDEKNSKCIL